MHLVVLLSLDVVKESDEVDPTSSYSQPPEGPFLYQKVTKRTVMLHMLMVLTIRYPPILG